MASSSNSFLTKKMMSCMNALCGGTSTSTSTTTTTSDDQWKKGWPLRSGQFATLCHTCGSAYEQSIFCDVFHSGDSGWRDCTSCAKRLHCGCIASTTLLDFLDAGGVNCISCSKTTPLNTVVGDDKLKGVFGRMEIDSVSVDNLHLGCSILDKLKLTQPGNTAQGIGPTNSFHFQSHDAILVKQEEMLPLLGDNNNNNNNNYGSASFSKLYQPSDGGPAYDAKSGILGAKDLFESLAQTNLSISLGNSIFQQGTRSRHLLPKPPKPAMETNTGTIMVPQIRVARPPAEGRGRNQLLPRYWPRITDQELQQISGDPNSTVVPLFEKVLSASDAGRIGRLVLPKACAEAYFPPISQPEGLPIRIQDIKGKEWVFQFRFWPNNNSRMYVLEGVTPCIQSMQLQAGDTVTFSRKDPEGKLVMGFRKASNSGGIQAYDVSLW